MRSRHSFHGFNAYFVPLVEYRISYKLVDKNFMRFVKQLPVKCQSFCFVVPQKRFVLRLQSFEYFIVHVGISYGKALGEESGMSFD